MTDNRVELKGRKVNGIEKSLIDLSKVTRDTSALCPIRYVYNYLPQETSWLKPQRISLTSPGRDDTMTNSIAILPEAAHIPFHTGLTTVRQTKHWKANEEATRGLLELFAKDPSCHDVTLAHGQSLASLAKAQLESSVLDDYSRFSVYMYPDADEKRIRLIAQSIILIFIFDGEYPCSPRPSKAIAIHYGIEKHDSRCYADL